MRRVAAFQVAGCIRVDDMVASVVGCTLSRWPCALCVSMSRISVCVGVQICSKFVMSNTIVLMKVPRFCDSQVAADEDLDHMLKLLEQLKQEVRVRVRSTSMGYCHDDLCSKDQVRDLLVESNCLHNNPNIQTDTLNSIRKFYRQAT